MEVGNTYIYILQQHIKHVGLCWYFVHNKYADNGFKGKLCVQKNIKHTENKLNKQRHHHHTNGVRVLLLN